MKRLVLTTGILFFVMMVAGQSSVVAKQPSEKFKPPKGYYLALGDSIAYGLQMHKVFPGVPATAFDTGYVDVLASKLDAIRPGIEVINYSCSGETTTSFVSGGCPWTATGGPLHADYEGSQLDAAISFLRSHRGKVSPITVHLFGNDVSDFVASCGGDFTCIQQNAPAAISLFAGRLQFILKTLRSAAPDAQIIVTSGWNPRVDFIAESDPLFLALRSAMDQVITAEKAAFVDLTSLFNPNPNSARLAALCALTLTCTHGDSHPSDAGYITIANAIFDSGYDQFKSKH